MRALWHLLQPGKSLRIVAQCLLGVALLFLFLRQVDLSTAAAALMRAALMPILIALAVYMVDFLLRAVRFWMLLQAVTGRSLPLAPVPAPFIASFGISDLLPLRAGDLFRLAWFTRTMTLRTGSVLGAMAIERFYDLSALLLLAVMLLAWQLPGWSGVALVTAALLAMVAAPVLLSRLPVAPSSGGTGLWPRIRDALRDAIAAFHILRSWRRALSLTLLSLTCWLLEALLFLCAWISLGGAARQWESPMAAFTASTLGTLIPGLPGHFGTFELFGLEAFTRTGTGADQGAAVLLLAHLLLWAPTALFAIGWLPFSGQAAKQTDRLLPQG